MKKFVLRLYLLFFLSVFFLIPVKNTFANEKILESILKPVRFDPVNTKGAPAEGYPDPFDPFYINEADTRFVDVYFILKYNPQGKDPNGNDQEYHFCFKKDAKDCNTQDGTNLGKKITNQDFFGLGVYDQAAADYLAGQKDPDGNPIIPNNTLPQLTARVIRVRVCGNGADDLKTDCDPNKPQDVWFHGGSDYRVGLYEKINNAQNGQDQYNAVDEAVFHVAHFYPNVFANLNGGTKLLANSPAVKPTNPPGTPQPDNGDIVFSNISYPVNNLEIKLTGRNPGGNTNNNYSLKLFGNDVPYIATYCTTVGNEKLDYASAKNEDPVSFTNLHQGKYTLTVEEQINEKTGKKKLIGGAAGIAGLAAAGVAFTLGAGPLIIAAGPVIGTSSIPVILGKGCDAGRLYWKIPVQVKEIKDSSGKSQNPKRADIIFHMKDAEVDPTNLDPLIHGQNFPIGKLAPCDEGKDINGEVASSRDKIILCTSIPTGLGFSISTDPVIFIKQIFSYILSLAGIIAVILLIISGYRLMSSAGDKQKIAGARETITSAIIGLLFIIFSLVLLQVIGVDLLKIPGLSQ